MLSLHDLFKNMYKFISIIAFLYCYLANAYLKMQ